MSECAVVPGSGLAALSNEEIEARLVSWSAREAVVRAELLAVLAVFVERRGWERWECSSPQMWLSWKCGLGKVAASEHVRVAMALTRLPRIAASFRAGFVTWSKVRAITRVATPASEEVWLRLARAGTAEHVDRVVRAFRRVTPADAEHQHADRRFWVTQDDDGSVVLHAKLPAPIGSGIASALRSTVEPARGVPLSARLADRFVEAVTGGAPVVPEVIFHVDAAVLDGEPGLCATVTGHAVAPGTALQAVCDGSVSWVVHDGTEVVAVSRKRRFASAVQRRAAEARSSRCEVEGCDEAGRDFHMHHLRPFGAKGATTQANLRRLCAGHHRRVHLHGLQLELTDSGRVRLVGPDGTPVDRRIPNLPVRERRPVGSPVPLWGGEPLDIDLTLDAILSAAAYRRRLVA